MNIETGIAIGLLVFLSLLGVGSVRQMTLPTGQEQKPLNAPRSKLLRIVLAAIRRY